MNSSTAAKRAPAPTHAEPSAPAPGAFLAAEGLVIETDPHPIQPEAVDIVEQAAPAAPITFQQSYREIVRTTGWFVLYGTGGFALVCIIVGAFEALFGR